MSRLSLTTGSMIVCLIAASFSACGGSSGHGSASVSNITAEVRSWNADCRSRFAGNQSAQCDAELDSKSAMYDQARKFCRSLTPQGAPELSDERLLPSSSIDQLQCDWGHFFEGPPVGQSGSLQISFTVPTTSSGTQPTPTCASYENDNPASDCVQLPAGAIFTKPAASLAYAVQGPSIGFGIGSRDDTTPQLVMAEWTVFKRLASQVGFDLSSVGPPTARSGG